jgi:hypothetical protein
MKNVKSGFEKPIIYEEKPVKYWKSKNRLCYTTASEK